MKILATLITLLVLVPLVVAVDISPSRQNIPEKFKGGGGKRFSIFAGDPERVQRANEVKVTDFSGEVEVEPQQISIAALRANSSEVKPTMRFRVFNNGKRPYTLSFPDSQRFDYLILDPAGNLFYEWSADKMFVERVDSTSLNPKERLSYQDEIPLAEKLSKLQPGTYLIKAILSNYPEITAERTFQVTP
jgi:hypothetical protein